MVARATLVYVPDELTLTQENIASIKPTPADLAEAMLILRASEQSAEDQKQAQERLVMGAFGSWFKRWWKHVAGIGTVILTLVGGGYRVLGWVQTEAETQVLERQATEKQAEAVEDNTAAVDELSGKQDELSERVERTENKVDATAKMNQVLLELQLRDPRVKRILKNDKKLKKKVDSIPFEIEG
jgi:flagellar biosynthesis/type III secretory pathway M-ring protein FliF/YscJ